MKTNKKMWKMKMKKGEIMNVDAYGFKIAKKLFKWKINPLYLLY